MNLFLTTISLILALPMAFPVCSYGGPVPLPTTSTLVPPQTTTPIDVPPPDFTDPAIAAVQTIGAGLATLYLVQLATAGVTLAEASGTAMGVVVMGGMGAAAGGAVVIVAGGIAIGYYNGQAYQANQEFAQADSTLILSEAARNGQQLSLQQASQLNQYCGQAISFVSPVCWF